MIIEGKIIEVWFSCGAASFTAAALTLEQYGASNEVRILNNFIAEEHQDNRRFLRDAEKHLGQQIIDVKSSKFPSGSAVEVWAKRRYMEGIAGAPCTHELKRVARQEWEANNPADYIVMGYTADEAHRHERFIREQRDTMLPILIDAGMTKSDCFKYVADRQLRLPEIYKMGYPNANCIGCVKATSPTYWNHVRKMHPDTFEERAVQSRDIGARLVRHKGERIFLDELPADAMGRPMKDLYFECGLFCEDYSEAKN